MYARNIIHTHTLTQNFAIIYVHSSMCYKSKETFLDLNPLSLVPLNNHLFKNTNYIFYFFDTITNL